MKVPREIKTYCPRCRTHRVFTVTLYKAGKRRALSWGERRHEEEKKGYGGQKYPLLRRKAKTTKKQTLKMRCKECGYTLHRKGVRMKRMEVV
ncbi:MAG: 50S ribosomal protein L44 [Candidatus Bathyarchaeota archaeon B23]|nr:MAG: 50S ribosomal protein L44 [Candidatus Bathyarchaeota archaeon B23]